MTSESQEDVLTRYLLGALSPDEQERVEERFLTDPDYYELMLAVEDDLVDAYVHAELSDDERARFDEHYLHDPARRDKVAFARALTRAAAAARVAAPPTAPPTQEAAPAGAGQTSSVVHFPHRGSRMTAAPWVALAAGLALVLGAGWLAVETVRLRREVERSEAEKIQLARQGSELEERIKNESERVAEVERQLERERVERERLERRLEELATLPAPAPSPTPTTPSVFAFTLGPGGIRGGAGNNRVEIPGKTDFLVITLELDPNSTGSTYEASVVSDRGEVWRARGLRPRGPQQNRTATLRIPANRLPPGDYQIALERVTASGTEPEPLDYRLRVAARP